MKFNVILTDLMNPVSTHIENAVRLSVVPMQVCINNKIPLDASFCEYFDADELMIVVSTENRTSVFPLSLYSLETY